MNGHTPQRRCFVFAVAMLVCFITFSFEGVAQVIPRPVELLILNDVFDGLQRTVNVPIEPSVQELAIEFQSNSVSFEIKRPNGTTVTVGDVGVTRAIDGDRVTYIVTNPDSGPWQILSAGSGVAAVAVSGSATASITKSEFVEAVSLGHGGLFSLDGKPARGRPTTIRVQTANVPEDARFELRAVDGSLLLPLSLTRGVQTESNEFVGDFTPPSNSFLLYLLGTDAAGYPYQRVWPQVLTAEQVVVEAPSASELVSGHVNRLQFNLTNAASADTISVTVKDTAGFHTPETRLIALSAGETAQIDVYLSVPGSAAVGTYDSVTVTAETSTGSINEASVRGRLVEPSSSTPNIVGLAFAEAITALESVGLVVGPVNKTNSNDVAGVVLEQQPSAGTVLGAGASVGVVLSSKSGQVDVPNVTGLSSVAAIAALTAAGLNGGAVSQEWNDGLPAGTVVLQVPTSGASVPADSAVALTIACSANVSLPESINPPPGGSAVSGTLTSTDDCGWAATSDVSWTTVRIERTDANSGRVDITVSLNSGVVPRFGTVTVANRTIPVIQAGQPCSYVVGFPITNVGQTGGSGIASVSTVNGCQWTAVSDAEWLTITSGSSGNGNGDMGFVVAANPTAQSRVARVTIAAQVFTITQAGLPCTFDAEFPIATAPSTGGSGTAAVYTVSGCSWTATSDVEWLTITSGASGSDSAPISFSIAANPSTSSRVAHVTIAGEVFTVTQSGVTCSFVVTFPFSSSVPSGGATATATVATASPCTWTATSDSAWLTITTETPTTGGGSVGLAATANPASAQRVAHVTIAGQVFAVTQLAGGCTYAFAISSMDAPNTAYSASVGVSATAGCQWTAMSDAGWLSISVGSGTGNGTVSFYWTDANTVAPRIGHLTIADQTFTVTQAGLVGSASINQSAIRVGASGGNGEVTVTANAPDYAWTATSSSPWLTITSPPGGVGSGAVTWVASANTGQSARIATVTIAGQLLEITQSSVGPGPFLFLTNHDVNSLTNSTRVYVVDTSTNQVVGSVLIPGTFTHAVTVTPDGRHAWVANTYGHSIAIIDTAATLVATIPIPDYPRAVGFHPDGTRAYVVNQVGVVRVIDTAARTIIKTVDLSHWDLYNGDWVPYFMNVGVAPSGDRLYLADATGNVVVYDTQSDTAIKRIALPSTGQWTTVTPDGSRVLATSSALGNGVYIIDVATNEILRRVTLPWAPRGVAVSPDGRTAFVAIENDGPGEPNYVVKVDLSTFAVTNFPEQTSGPRGVVVHPDGSKVYATSNTRLAILDIVTGTLTYLPVGGCCGVQIAIQQPQPPLRLSVGSRVVRADAQVGAFDITALSPAAAWSASSDSEWLTLTGATAGVGGGSVTYAMSPNLTGAMRRGTITVGDQVFTVVQQEGHYQVSTIAGRSIELSNSASMLPVFANALATDSAGNLYVSMTPRAVYRISQSGIATRIAGDGTSGVGGDGGPAIDAQFSGPFGVAIDGSGNVLVADAWTQRIRKINGVTGVITTIVGGNGSGFSGDGGFATNARVSSIRGIALDSFGNLYIADVGNFRVRKVTTAGVISTIAGIGISGFAGDGGPAINATLGEVFTIATDPANHVYLLDRTNNRVRKIDAITGAISTIVGSGATGFSPDGTAASAASLAGLESIAIGGDGKLYFIDNNRVRSVDSAGRIITIAGNGNEGDGGLAVSARLLGPGSLAVSTDGTIFIGEQNGLRVRRISAGIISTVVGPLPSGEGLSALDRVLLEPTRIAVDASGDVYVNEFLGHRVLRISHDGTLTTAVGIGEANGGPDGVLGNLAPVAYPSGVAVDSVGDVIVADATGRVRRLSSATGLVTTIAGTIWNNGFSGDGGLATNARLGYNLTVAIDGSDNVFIADPDNARIRRVDRLTGVITTVAGNGVRGYSGDGGLAINARLGYTNQIAVDVHGNLYIGDVENGRIRRVDAATGQIATIVGTGTQGYNGGDGGPAVSAQIGWSVTLALDPAGVLYFADAGSNRIRKVANGIITTVAGTGASGLLDGDAFDARINMPLGIAIGPNRLLYLADTGNGRIRKLTPFGTIEELHLPSSFSKLQPASGDRTSQTSATLQWSPSSYASSYQYCIDTVNDGICNAAWTSVGAAKNSSLIGLLPGTVYFWQVRASNSHGHTDADGGGWSWFRTATNGPESVPSDLDGDAKTEFVVFRPSNGVWYLRYSSQNYALATYGSVQWGVAGDTPLSADFDGDGKTDIAVYRPTTGTWFIRYSSQDFNIATYATYSWGAPGDVPVIGDFDGDGKDDLTAYRPSSGTWFIRYSTHNYNAATHGAFAWGVVGDIPLSGDFDADGTTDIAVYRPSTGTWFIRYSSDGFALDTYGIFQWGIPNDMPLNGDFDGDGRADVAIYRPSSGEWFIRYSSRSYAPAEYGYAVWGGLGDKPTTGDFDGDGKTEIAVYRPSTGEWFIRYSSQGYAIAGYGAFQWGAPGDMPIK